MAQQEHNPGIAAALSAFFTGLGQIYCGSIARGLCIMFVGPTIIVILAVLMIVGSVTGAGTPEQAAGGMGAAYILISLGSMAYWVFNIYDAYNLANTLNNQRGRGRRGGGRRRSRSNDRRRPKSEERRRRPVRADYNDVDSDVAPRRRSKIGRKNRPVRRAGRSRSSR